MNANQFLKMAKGFPSVILGFGSAAFLAQNFIFDVKAGHRGIIYSRFSGILDKSYGEGTHFLIPFVQKAILFEVRTRPRTITSITGTKDLQQVNISLRILSHPRETKIPIIYRNLGKSFEERVLPSIGNEVLKSIVAQYNADELITMREKISKQINETLTVRAGQFNIVLDDISITHLSFSPEFSKAIEQKQIAEQDAERAKFMVIKSEHEKAAAVIKSEGESEAAKLISNALQKSGNGLIKLRKIETAKQVTENLAKAPNVSYLPSNANILLDPSKLE
ncbi:hypothetical protein MHBO_002102 [Bonamia ostreae]|uniref:Prohibitin n=1 Tax=Bonamia ostreae TaxID=126728 RepID=A0ABV2ALA0_9EUKA